MWNEKAGVDWASTKKGFHVPTNGTSLQSLNEVEPIHSEIVVLYVDKIVRWSCPCSLRVTMDVKISLERKEMEALGIPDIETENVAEPAVEDGAWESDAEMTVAVNEFERFVA